MVDIGIGHMIKAMQMQGFGHEEIMAVRKGMISGDFSDVNFCSDVYTDDWDESEKKAIKEPLFGYIAGP